MPPPRVDPSVAGEARERLAAIEAKLAPAPAATVRKWLASLAAISERPPVDEALRNAVDALAGTLDLPACCYSPESLRHAAATCRWFPGYGSLVAAIGPFAEPLRAEAAALRAVIDGANRPPGEAPPRWEAPRVRTREEVAHVQARAQEAKAHLAAVSERKGSNGRVRGAARLLLLSRETLLAQYERLAAEGGPTAAACAERARQLRAEIARERHHPMRQPDHADLPAEPLARRIAAE